MKTMSVKVFARIACLIMAVAMAVSLVGCGVDITSVGLPTDIVLERVRPSSSISSMAPTTRLSRKRLPRQHPS